MMKLLGLRAELWYKKGKKERDKVNRQGMVAEDWRERVIPDDEVEVVRVLGPEVVELVDLTSSAARNVPIVPMRTSKQLYQCWCGCTTSFRKHFSASYNAMVDKPKEAVATNNKGHYRTSFHYRLMFVFEKCNKFQASCFGA